MAKKDSVLKSLSKKLPKGSVFKLSDTTPIETISSGISTLDYALGGGFARGQQHLIYGASSTGKSALVLNMIGNYQKSHPDSLAAVIDLEKSMTPEWAEKFGINVEDVHVVRPSDVEEMITSTMEAIKGGDKERGAFDIIMVDSLGAGLLRSEIDNDVSRMAGSSGAITRLVKAANSALTTLENNLRAAEQAGEDTSDFVIPVVVLINQVRVDMNSMYGGNTYPGGKALTHMMSTVTQLKVSKAAGEKIEGTVDGMKLRVGWSTSAVVEKNKLAAPGKTGGYTFVFQECPEHPFGVDDVKSVCDLALATGIARIDGRTIYYPTPSGEEGKVVGRNNFDALLHENEELVDFLAEEISRRLTNDMTDKSLEVVEEMNNNDE